MQFLGDGYGRRLTGVFKELNSKLLDVVLDLVRSTYSLRVRVCAARAMMQ
jgi:hypothetical protein